MRQHAIPQNILDVEFKLFTKFTLKEFSYLAIGLGFGGVMLYMMASEMIPGVLGLPVALISAGAGIFLGLVPINDQDADVFVKNYITAITNPTQRVWMNKDMKAERTKPDVKPSEDGHLIPKDVKEEKKRIIGVSLPTDKTTSEDSEVDLLGEDINVDEDLLTSPPLNPAYILINDQNLSSYQFSIKSLDKLPGNINIWLCTSDYKPIPNVIVYLKSTRDKILYANRTGVNGYFLTNKIWEPDTYILEFHHPVYKFPKVEIELTNRESKLPIKINNI